MRRLIIEDEALDTRVIYDVNVMDGLMLSETQEAYLKAHMKYYDQFNGGIVVDRDAVLLARGEKSPVIKHNNGYTLDDIISYHE
jgi:hypothetical protein